MKIKLNSNKSKSNFNKNKHNHKNIDLSECIDKCSSCLVTPLGGVLCRIIGDYVDVYNYDCPKRTKGE